MVGFMRWEHKENIGFLIAVLLPLVTGITSPLFISDSNTAAEEVIEEVIEEIEQKNICFDRENLVTLVTADLLCPESFISLGNSRLTESATATGSIEEMHPLLLARFNTAAEFAKADGVTLYITSGFRSLDRQEILFQEAVRKYGSESEAAKWVLPPQFSHHPKGLAIDVNYPGDKAGAYWLETNGSRFGLCRVYANEWWHFEGVIAPGQRCPAPAPNALIDLG
jgi:D-alanyl-D-alanine dipeptidase